MDDRKCFYCPADKDLRPYGPGGAWVCHPCATATPERRAQTEASFAALLTAAEIPTGTTMLTDKGPVDFNPTVPTGSTVRHHALVRTSPKGKGQKFIGTCMYCGAKGLGPRAAHEPCTQ